MTWSTTALTGSFDFILQQNFPTPLKVLVRGQEYVCKAEMRWGGRGIGKEKSLVGKLGIMSREWIQTCPVTPVLLWHQWCPDSAEIVHPCSLGWLNLSGMHLLFLAFDQNSLLDASVYCVEPWLWFLESLAVDGRWLSKSCGKAGDALLGAAVVVPPAQYKASLGMQGEWWDKGVLKRHPDII